MELTQARAPNRVLLGFKGHLICKISKQRAIPKYFVQYQVQILVLAGSVAGWRIVVCKTLDNRSAGLQG